MVFHQEQLNAGNEIIDKFTNRDAGQPFTVLLAQMQSGKTGTYLFTALEMVRLGLIKNVNVICGSSDTSLRAQTRRDLDDSLKSFQRETISGGDTDGALRLMDANIGVYFSQDLGKLEDISEETLIIHDESHMAQSKNNIPFKRFYQKNNLDKALMGDFSELVSKKCYILGVSATPFSEIVANKKVQTSDWTTEESSFLDGVELSPKNFYFMQPGSGYIGVTQFLELGAIKFEAENIKVDECDHIVSVLKKNSPKYDKKYVVIRTLCAEKDMDMMQTIASSTGYEYVSVFGGEGSLEFMKVQPLKATLVHICGKFRMGQVVPKGHIAMVYEQSKNPNADTILQGLLGRMCGYNQNGAHTGVDIYVSQMAEELIHKYSKAWREGAMDELSTVTKAMNLGGVKRKNGGIIKEDGFGNQWIMTVPVKFKFKDLERDFGGKTKFRQITPLDLINLFEDKPDLISSNPDKDEILKLLEACAKVKPEKQPNASYLHHNTKKTSWDTDCSSLENAIGNSKRLNISHYTSRDIKNLNKPEKVRFSPISVYGSGKCDGNCYLMGYVQYNPDVHGLIAEELAQVDPKCNYIPGIVQMEDGSDLDDVNGGQIIPFSIDTTDDPESLEVELEKAILRTQEGHPTYIEGATKAIHSLFDNETRLYEGIRLDKSVYTEEHISSIKTSLDRRLGVSITFKKSRGRQPKDQIKYASISW
tara:strand:+ start:374 stop:2482 length:2109 start_codon:yes stop_codon:yes gene_type:complete